jgi:hypothetical protein
MEKPNNNSSGGKNWTAAVIAGMLILSAPSAQAQEGSQGNTTIFGGAEMTFFADHNFAAGGGGTQPGVILTDRAAGNFGILNFSGPNLVSTNASDAGYVDGYVRKYGTGQFIFPVGDNGSLGQFAASADGTMGAYFHSDPNTAVTSNLFTGTDYIALPTGGPFATSSMGANLDVVSTVEYWDIDGTGATPLTLTWDAGSAIATLTGSQLNKLTIVGWDGTQWMAISSKVDVISVLSGTSDLTAGSITTTAAIAPNTYTAYAFASLTVPLPVTLARFEAVREGGTALLTWSTTEETSSDRFDVERSADGSHWKNIGVVQSTGESKTQIDYRFVDVNPYAENLYRLRMVDNDGTFAYSRIRNVRFENLENRVVYPNPANDRLFIKDYTRVSDLRILDMNGKVVHRLQALKNGEVNVSQLTTGVHVVEITWPDGEKTTQKILIRE